MSSVLRSLDPQPRWVYLLRRTLVAVGLVVALVLAFVLIRAITGGAGDDEPETPPETSETPAPETEADGDADAGAAAACEAADLQLALTSDATTYAAGANPTFTVTISNIGDGSCTVDAGSAAVDVLVTSGSDRIWSALDCAAADAEGAERMLLLTEGAQESAVVAWSRVRSNATCDTGLAAPRPGTYHAVASLQGASSGDLVFTLE